VRFCYRHWRKAVGCSDEMGAAFLQEQYSSTISLVTHGWKLKDIYTCPKQLLLGGVNSSNIQLMGRDFPI
jgi:hypothetical protein